MRKSEIPNRNEADKRPYLWYGEVYNVDKYVDLRYSEYYNLISPRIREGVRILDIAGYTGKLLDFLPSFVEYYDVDFDEGALQAAVKKGARVVRVDLEKEEIPLKSKFEIIVATEILEHLRNPERVVTQMKQLAEEDGIILISLPNECTLYHRLKYFIGKGVDTYAFSLYKHLHFPNLKQNEAFISSHFEIVEKKYWIHTGVGGKLQEVFSKIPYAFWAMMANLWPSLFARGVIYLCKLRQE